MSKAKYTTGNEPGHFVAWKDVNREALIQNFEGGKHTHEFADFTENEHAKFLRRHIENDSTPTP
jgi:hypothetical protein